MLNIVVRDDTWDLFKYIILSQNIGNLCKNNKNIFALT